MQDEIAYLNNNGYFLFLDYWGGSWIWYIRRYKNGNPGLMEEVEHSPRIYASRKEALEEGEVRLKEYAG